MELDPADAEAKAGVARVGPLALEQQEKMKEEMLGNMRCPYLYACSRVAHRG